MKGTSPVTVRLVEQREPPTIAATMEANEILFLNLDEFFDVSTYRRRSASVDAAVRRLTDWIEAAHTIYLRTNRDDILPMICVLGSPWEVTDEALEQIAAAGAIFWEKPEDYSRLSRKERVNVLKSEVQDMVWAVERYPVAISSQGADVDRDHLGVMQARFRADQDDLHGHDPTKDPLAIFLDPPYQLSDEDFQELLNRTRTSLGE